MRNVPFTISADLELGMRVAPYIVDSSADVTIREGDVPEMIADATDGVSFMANANQLLMTIPNGLRFIVSDGDKIIYERNGVSDREAALFLLGSAWGGLCYQRGLLPLHASGVVEKGEVHAFTGPSGAGKSTLSAALADRGRSFFTDDILIIDPADIGEKTICYAGQKDLKLWNDALKLTDAEKMSAVRDVEDFQKFFAIPANANDASAGHLASLSILASKNIRKGLEPISIERLSGARALKQLRDSVYRPQMANVIWGRQKLYTTLAKLIASVHVQTFDRPMVRDQFTQSLASIDDWIGDWVRSSDQVAD